MSDRLKFWGKKLLWVLITFILLELLLLATLEVIITLSEARLDISGELMLQNLQQMITNLPTVIRQYWTERNPLFIIGTFAILIYSFVLNRRRFTTNGWETETENAYHGSARWGRPDEIFDKKGNFQPASKRQIQSNFAQSIKGSDK